MRGWTGGDAKRFRAPRGRAPRHNVENRISKDEKAARISRSVGVPSFPELIRHSEFVIPPGSRAGSEQRFGLRDAAGMPRPQCDTCQRWTRPACCAAMWLCPRISPLWAVAFLALMAPAQSGAQTAPGRVAEPTATRSVAPTVIITVPPFLEATEAANRTAGGTELELAAAQQALELGFLTAARASFTAILNSHPPAAQQARASLGLASVEIAAEQPDAAEAALSLGAELNSPRTRLRRALIALLRKDTGAAGPLIEGLLPDSVPAEEAAWVHVAQATHAELLAHAAFRRSREADARGQRTESAALFREYTALDTRAATAYTAALTRALSLLARARILLAKERMLLLAGKESEADIRTEQQRMDQFPGQSVGLVAARTLAALYYQLGRRDAARSVLLSQIPLVSPDLRATADDLRLMLALVSGIDSTGAQNELRYLLSSAVTPEIRRMALELLANAATTVESQDRLRGELDARVAEASPSPILEDLLLYRARLALLRKDFVGAEDDVNTLLSRFPGSMLRVPARALLVSAAWERRQYRTAADAVRQLLEERGLDPAHRGALIVLQAESYFYAQDFRSAAGAYGAVLGTGALPAGTTPGAMMFQQVLSLMKAEQLDDTAQASGFPEAQALLDRLSRDAAFDPVSRWQAEWNLAKALQARGRGAVAYERVTRLLGPGPTTVPPDLGLRMAWLQAKLSLEARQPRATLEHVEKLLAGPAANTAASVLLREQVSAAAVLLRAQAMLELNDVESAVAEVAAVRKRYPGSDSAIYSHLTLASYYAANDKQDRAQAELQELVERYGDSEYAPFAMYQLAVSEEQRGFSFYPAAYNRLEEMVKKYPKDPLVFYARMRQGALLVVQNKPDVALRLYRSLVVDFPNHPDRAQAELELARAEWQQWGNDPSRLGTPMSSFERLFDSRGLPVEVRVEAGYMLAYLTALRGNKADARRVLWNVVDRFLLNGNSQANLEGQGRDFIGRALFDYARLCEEENQIQEARRAYELVVKFGLPGTHRAGDKLAASPTL